MANDRWKQIEQIYHAALEREENQRALFLQEACAGDQQLRREVESLLAQEGTDNRLLERPALEVVAKMLHQDRAESLIGRRLGCYEIQSLLGAGGMGEVYKARDTKLRRDVAIKVIPAPFAKDRERIVRFRREAQLLASLNHPSIAAIYGLEELDGATCLVMELVPGKTLSERIKQGAVPVEEALTIGKQIAEALEAAHEKSVIHRDLKPANVKVTPEGKVKVLDFGLAKAFGDANEQAASEAPTMITAGAQPGMILGTPPYMSPEQASGKTVDKRTDIWAFGCVFYELLSGKPAFAGESITDTLGAVLHKEPDWSVLPPATPPTIRTLLRRCLQKDARERFRDAGDIRIQIEEARAVSATAALMSTPASARRRWLLLGGAACLAAAAIGGIAVWQLRPAPSASAQPAERVIVALPANTTLPQTTPQTLFGVLALSPDGRHLAYAAIGNGSPQQLYVRAMDGLEATPLAGTEGAFNPFFSPDGDWIGFTAGSTLTKISVGGGAALTICNISGSATLGAAWGTDNTVVFADAISPGSSALMRVSAAGGEPQPFNTLQRGETSHLWPQFLPDGKTVLFTIGTGANYDDAEIAVQRLDSSERKILVRGGSYGRYVPTGSSAGLRTGHLVYYHAGTLMAVPFDPVTLEVKGSVSSVVEDVSGNTQSGLANFSVSNSGTLAYVRGGVAQSNTQTMVWVNRQGVATPFPAPPRNYRAPRLSPDGRQVAVGIGSDVWLYDIPRDTLTRLTFEKYNAGTAATWTADGKRIVFPSDRAGPINLFWKPVDGSGPEERLTTSPNTQRGSSFSADGRFFVYTDIAPKTVGDLWILPMEGDRKPRVFLQTPFDEGSGQFSPDGHWIAYVSNESGRLEVYVRPFPGPGGKWQISTDGGSEAAWNTTGKELFFRTGARREKMMVVEYQTQPTFSAGRSRLLFEGNYVANITNGSGAFYSVAPDGQRFLMTKTSEQPQASLTQINVVLNWFEELKQKVPTGK